MTKTFKRHWPEYLMEAAGLGIFMISAAVMAIVLEHPTSPIRQTIDDPFVRRIPMGLAMGLTAICIIYSPWGKQSGAHINPVITFTFFRLGKINGWDTTFYIIAQFIGGCTGLYAMSIILHGYLDDPSVNYVMTIPGSTGIVTACIAELIISFGLMTVVLICTNSKKWNSYTGVLAGILVATYIIFEAPLSGMSMNPARTVASSLPSLFWEGIWIYFVFPTLGMLLAAEIYLRFKENVLCAKLHHQNSKRCIFRCGYHSP